jgi:hypothetical protein
MMPLLPPASIAMFVIVILASIDISASAGPTNSIARYSAPSTPILAITARTTSLL